MSMGTCGKQVHCDGEDCQAVTSLPIALRSQLLPPELRPPTEPGWLFISGNGPSQHFCPRCAESQMRQIADCEIASLR